jgi:hypothetical protein
MEIASPTLDDSKARLEDKDPVLALLSEISATLKDLNSAFKDHAERLVKLERQKPGDESGPRDSVISEQGEGDDGPVRTQSAHQNPEASGSSKSLTPKLITQHPQTPQETMDDFIEVKFGTFPPLEAYRFAGSLQKKPPLWENQDYLLWLKKKCLVFPDDGRCIFPFDIITLARSLDLNTAHQKIDQMESFCRDLRKEGGFFFFRESDMQGGNKIWNGLDIFTLPDNFPPPIARKRETEDEMLAELRMIEREIAGHYGGVSRLFSGPSTFYKYREGEVRWQMKTPFRRLW